MSYLCHLRLHTGGLQRGNSLLCCCRTVKVHKTITYRHSRTLMWYHMNRIIKSSSLIWPRTGPLAGKAHVTDMRPITSHGIWFFETIMHESKSQNNLIFLFLHPQKYLRMLYFVFFLRLFLKQNFRKKFLKIILHSFLKYNIRLVLNLFR